jgi:PBP1b-binding outer membrane lipoprotein LpoB
MKQVISLVAILTVLLSGCAMSPTTSTTDPNRAPSRAQERPGSDGGGY